MAITARNHVPASATGLDRRELLVVLAASAASSLVALTPRSGAAEELLALHLGTLRGSELLVRNPEVLSLLSRTDEPVSGVLRQLLPPELPLEIVPAADMQVQPGDFPSGRARIVIHGILPPPDGGSEADLMSAAVSVDYFLPSGEGPFPFHAWSHASGPVINRGKSSSFSVPIAGGSEIRLRVNVTRRRRNGRPTVYQDMGANEQSSPAPVVDRLSSRHTDSDSDRRLTLRPGIYFVPLSTVASSALPLPATYDFLVPEGLSFLAFSVVPEEL